jgi:hypothetical protein
MQSETYLMCMRLLWYFILPYFIEIGPSNSYFVKIVQTILYRPVNNKIIYEGVSKSFRIGLLERELRMAQLSATTCTCISIM